MLTIKRIEKIESILKTMSDEAINSDGSTVNEIVLALRACAMLGETTDEEVEFIKENMDELCAGTYLKFKQAEGTPFAKPSTEEKVLNNIFDVTDALKEHPEWIDPETDIFLTEENVGGFMQQTFTKGMTVYKYQVEKPYQEGDRVMVFTGENNEDVLIGIVKGETGIVVADDLYTIESSDIVKKCSKKTLQYLQNAE